MQGLILRVLKAKEVLKIMSPAEVELSLGSLEIIIIIIILKS